MPLLGDAAEVPTPDKPAVRAKAPASGTSSYITEAIRTRLPAFTPLPPPPPVETPVPGSAEAVVLLAKVIVTEKKTPSMSEFQMLTQAGQRAFLNKEFPGMTVPVGDPLGESTPNYASLALRDKVRQTHIRNLEDTVGLYRFTGDVEGGKKLKEEMQRAVIRSYDWRDERLDRAYNNDRR